MTQKRTLSDNEAIALMVLHYGGNPIRNIEDHRDKNSKKIDEPYWLLLHPERMLTPAEQLIASAWHASEGDVEHDNALFVVACDAQEAAKLWRTYYGRGELPCRVTTVPTLLLSHQCQMTPGFVVEWDKIT